MLSAVDKIGDWPRLSASTIGSRYGSQALTLGARVGAGLAASVDTVPQMAGFASVESVATSTEWPVLPPVRLAARARAPESRRPANSREPSRGHTCG